jgi:hypothetical protein
MKFIKWLLISLFILILLVGGSVFVLITFYKKDLTNILVEELQANYGLKLQVGDIDVSFIDNWPHASVELEDIILESELNKGKSEAVLKAGSLALSLNVEQMLHKQFVVRYISIKDADIVLIKNPDGSKNFVFKKETLLPDTVMRVQVSHEAQPEKTAIDFRLNKISIKNTRFRYINKQRQQNIDLTIPRNDIRLDNYQEGIKARMKGNIEVAQLLFQARKGAFLVEKESELDLTFTYMNDTKTLCVYPPSHVEIEKQKYNVCLLVKLGDQKRLEMILDGQNMDFVKTANLLTPKIQRVLSNFEVNKPVSAKVILALNIGKREDPALRVDFSGEGNDVAIGNSKIPYSDVSFKGTLLSVDSTGKKGQIEKAWIDFYDLKGNVYDFPFTGNVKVTNLVDPFIDINADLSIDAARIKFNLSKDFVMKGNATANIHYSGPTEKLNNREFLERPMKLNAELKFRNVSYQEINKPYTYIVNGDANLNNRDLKFDRLKLTSFVGDAVLKGKAENFVNYVLGYSNGFKASVAARTELLDLNPLLKTKKEEQGSVPVINQREIAEPKPSEKPKKGKTMQRLMQSRFEFNVQLFAKKLLVRKVEAQNANADLFYKNDYLEIKSLNLLTCDGKLKASGTIRDFNKIKADINASGVNVNKMFTQFENFGQEAVTNDNLRGVLSFDARFSTDMDEKFEVIGETMVGDVSLKLKDGHLLNYEPVQNLSNVLWKNRDFNDVSFSEIHENFRIRGYRMEISDLEIASNVLDLYVVNGFYDFKGPSNINFLVPWSNLKRRGKHYVPKTSGQSAESARGVKLNFQGPSKKMKLSFGHKELNEED